MSRNMFAALVVAAFALLQSCGTLAPKYHQPKAPVPTDWPSGNAYRDAKEAADAPKAHDLEWRTFINDEKLQKVIEMALENNRDLRAAALNVDRARAQYGLQRSQLLPTINVVADHTRQGMKTVAGYVTTEKGQPAAPLVTRVVSGQDSVSLGMASWEIDFFGRIRSMKNAAKQQFFATEQARRATQILLVAEVASTYYALAADRENLKLAQTTLETQQGYYDLIKRRFECGVAAELDVYRAQTQVDSARGGVAQYTQVVALDRNALNLLVGAPAPDELLAADLESVGAPKDIAAGISSEVLLNRPDVIQTEDLLKAANANIGAARAAFFPRIALTTGIGAASSDLSGLFDGGTKAWTFSPQIVWPIFDAQTWHFARVAKVEKKLAVTQYEKTIQNSFKEVADALAVRGTVDEQVAAQASLTGAVVETYRLSTIRYDKGADSYLSVLDAQRTQYAAQQGLVSLRLAKHTNQIRLYAVLGGGWNTPENEANAKHETAPSAKEPTAAH